MILGAECVERVAAWIADLEIPVEIWLGNDPGRDETSPVEIAGAHSGYVAEMKIEVDERGGQLGPYQFEDADGYVMPLAPGSGPRRIPLGVFPTGPEIGARLPEVVAVDPHGRSVDLHADRGAQPAVLVFYRSAVW